MTVPGTLLATRYRLLEPIGSVAWRRSGAPATCGSIATSRSSSCGRSSPRTRSSLRRFEVRGPACREHVAPQRRDGVRHRRRGRDAFIVMELVDGAERRRHPAGHGGPLPPGQAVDVAAAAARALAAAHRRGLDPPGRQARQHPRSAVMGRVRLADFGIARALTTSRRHRAGHVLGLHPVPQPGAGPRRGGERRRRCLLARRRAVRDAHRSAALDRRHAGRDRDGPDSPSRPSRSAR